MLSRRIASSLQRDGIQPGDAIAICAATSVNYAAMFLGALRAGVVVAPLAPGTTPQSLQGMLRDAQAKALFIDATTADTAERPLGSPIPRITLDGCDAGQAFGQWLAAAGSRPQAVAVTSQWPFNIIYSSGTTGEPKGIVQPHGMRWTHVKRAGAYGYGADTVTLLSTPLYSNTTLVVFFPTLAFGGTVVLMPKFDAAA